MGAMCGGGGGAKPLFDAEHLKTNPNSIQLTEEEKEGFVKTEEGYQEFLKRHKATEKEIPKVITMYKKELNKAKAELKKQGMGGFADMMDMFDEKTIKMGIVQGLEGMKTDITAQRELYKNDPEAWLAQKNKPKVDPTLQQFAGQDMMAFGGNFDMDMNAMDMDAVMKNMNMGDMMNMNQVDAPVNNDG